MKRKFVSLKDRIWKYMQKKNLSWREMSSLLGIENHQTFYYWMTKEKEDLSDIVEEKFFKLAGESNGDS